MFEANTQLILNPHKELRHPTFLSVSHLLQAQNNLQADIVLWKWYKFNRYPVLCKNRVILEANKFE
jgi:hypothetical protein